MRILIILFTLTCLIGCNGSKSDSVHTSPKVRSFGDTEEFPQSVRSVIELLKTMPPGCSIDEFQSALKQSGTIKTPFQHYKDYEHYWTIQTGSDNPPFFIIAGRFASTDNGYELTYSTLNVVEESGGKWKTIWCIEYQPDNVTPFSQPRLRGVSTDG